MSACLQGYHRRILTLSRKALFFKIKVSPFFKLLNKTSNLYILRDSETSKPRYMQVI